MRLHLGALLSLLPAACAGGLRKPADATAREALGRPAGVEPPRHQRELLRLPPLRVERFDFTPFPEEPPIEGANAAARHEEVVRVPRALRIEHETGGVRYGLDEERLEQVALDVGYRMILGCRIDWTVRRGESGPEWLSQVECGVPPGGGTASWPGDPSDCVFEAAIEVFETDIPPQHMWMPGAGQYRVLWRRTLSARPPG